MSLPARELLTSKLGTDGRWHACYPSAERTLCLMAVGPPPNGRPVVPDCGKCSRAARMLDRVSASMPDSWLLEGGQCRALAHVTQRRCERSVVRGSQFCASHQRPSAAAA